MSGGNSAGCCGGNGNGGSSGGGIFDDIGGTMLIAAVVAALALYFIGKLAVENGVTEALAKLPCDRFCCEPQRPDCCC